MHHPHTATAAAASGFDDHGVAHHLGNATNMSGIVWQFTFRAGHARHTCFDHGLFGRYFVSHDANRFRSRADELESALFNALGKVCVFT